MSSHRAVRHGSKRAAAPAPEPQSGRRRAVRAQSSRSGVSPSSMIGGAALLLAAVGAATAGQISSHTETVAATSHAGGGYVADLSSASLEGRDATQISRGGARPAIGSGTSTATKAEEIAQRRADRLREAANNAEKYADELSSDEWVLPTSGFHISTWFGEAGPYWSSGYHTGIDFATAYGTPVVAVSNLTVVQTGWDGPYGNQIRLQLENGDEVWYNHLSSIEVTVGETVLKGQEIGRVGDTGNAYGYHLHFEYRLSTDLQTGVDPLPYFEEHGIFLS